MRRQQEETFVAFATAAKPWLLTTAWMLAGDPHTAEDLVQETLVRLYTRWSRVGHQQPAAYARRVLANLHTDRWRRTRREVLVEDHAERSGGHAPDPVLVDLVRALQGLGPRERECVVLRHYLDLSEKQTAEALGVSVGAVKGYTSRGLGALRDVLKEADHV
ncbi:SigE family RNA polymerase sigma factor [Ornithinimicrobium avium]|uniref:SigE family RNA polymerase sigma factor n=1 Tax=Ornithinimicrobium avium TaxID=2283195 RepID=UPI0013B39BE1|nr:SigE family RNA polymerase sigma factor [Ornithinimicrobium avium]